MIMKTLLLFSLLVLNNNILQASARRCFPTTKYEVRIVNNLPENSPPLNVHCASADDDLGIHTLTLNNQVYSWNFCEAFLITTLFHCHLWWGSKQKNKLEVFRSTYVRWGSTTLFWSARSDGIYFSYYDNEDSFVKKFDWE